MSRPSQPIDLDYKSKDSVNIVHWNVQGFLGKRDEANLLAMKFNTDMLCVCEHWLSSDELMEVGLPDFKLISAFCRSSGQRGGTAIFLRSRWLGEEMTFFNRTV
ncbi:hypothetical protein J6590_108569 [Homalodisca vitripennis]|nr:hypothetical protein J6590_108569 [Homalodisca vitripennis]